MAVDLTVNSVPPPLLTRKCRPAQIGPLGALAERFGAILLHRDGGTRSKLVASEGERSDYRHRPSEVEECRLTTDDLRCSRAASRRVVHSS
jgi:hypothetical protein